jgi:hypothetical protein
MEWAMSTTISSQDNNAQRIVKLLPADLTAAFLAIKVGVQTAKLPEAYVFYGAVLILLIAPFYFRVMLKVNNTLHIGFLLVTFAIFATNVATQEFGATCSVTFNFGPGCWNPIWAISIVILPIWVFLVTPIVATTLGNKLEG